MNRIIGHLHLEGSVPTDFLTKIADRNALPDHAKLLRTYRPGYFASFEAFSKLIILTAQTLRTRKDFLQAGLLLGERLRHDGVLYAEILWVPQLYVAHAIEIDDILEALNEARDRTLANYGIEMNWIVDLVRGYPKQGELVMRWLQGFDPRSRHIVAVGLGGNETHPLSDMQDLLLSARELGIEIYPHAGEQCGPDQVEEVISVLAPRRIAHGIRAAERDATLQIIRSEGIHLDICPTSNLALRVYENMHDLPIPKLIAAQCAFSINTDDPALLGIDLESEIRQCVEVHGLTADFLQQMYRNAAEASFLVPEEKARLSRRLA